MVVSPHCSSASGSVVLTARAAAAPSPLLPCDYALLQHRLLDLRPRELTDTLLTIQHRQLLHTTSRCRQHHDPKDISGIADICQTDTKGLKGKLRTK